MMARMGYLPGTAVRLEALVARWERFITTLVTLCAVLAILLGIVWLFLRKDTLLFTILGFSAWYLIGRKLWRFRTHKMSLTS
jgi:hypothetical protein